MSNHPVLCNFMKGLFNITVVRKPLKETWDLPLVLSYLSSNPFEPLNSVPLRFLAIKLAFLLQLASGRRVSWTHAIKISPGYLRIRKEKNGYTFKPVLLLDKNQSAAYTPPPVFLAALSAIHPEDKLHCPIRALQYYLRRTKPFRGNIKSLFLAHTRPIRAARKDTVANWIKLAITGAYKGVTAEHTGVALFTLHNTRGVATSWAKLAGVPLEEVIYAAAWKTPRSFVNFYLKDLAGTKGRFGTAILHAAASAPE